MYTVETDTELYNGLVPWGIATCTHSNGHYKAASCTVYKFNFSNMNLLQTSRKDEFDHLLSQVRDSDLFLSSTLLV